MLASEYPRSLVLPALEGRDDSERTRMLTADLLERTSRSVGIYNVGAGNRGIAAALEAPAAPAISSGSPMN